jgi:S-adenosylmethionine-diacylgycerolhomoserine-N-methlytransferase
MRHASLAGDRGHGHTMDRQYRWQRHLYDVTRKYYLLGRDELIATLDVAPGMAVLEIGCGTGRNLALAQRRYPAAHLHGLDISAEMLKSARAAAPEAVLARGDATAFDAYALFGRTDFDRLFMSYTLSMIPDWTAALDQAARLIAVGGRLHIVDFGQQHGLPGWFRRMLHAWLARFHVTPRADLIEISTVIAARHGLTCAYGRVYRDYARAVTLTRPS